MKASRWALVSLTVDKYTVEARKISMDSDTMGFKADGEVSVADGKGTVRGTSAVFHFRHGRLIVKASGSPESDAD
jgi:lipopolysaccharide assembly outer membrane protein LptD (OstA)